ncbi:50S ribosomal protein L9 [Cerasicoccus arenae]|uniref:Large ribosomal subunit protein bL9 n=1 Tax=Cerasicoccus arenae TaxID=424488 RepID=A0A8J3GES7_9BACT|nr:50S ribosomal protein L9 [Cerasicoccus arenae]MBK1858177.1 50S ribosomal protein L9 [Cerasicoccus arenae]GHC01021.1 50S ribosomal protein L9 [Cerasicoccus arenae]
MNTDVLLLQPVESLGHEGDQVSVKAGYARNYLLPRNLALPVNRANKKYIESLTARKESRLKQEREHADQILARLETVSIAIAVKTGEGGKMFGSVSSQDLIDRLKEDGIEVERKQLNLHTPVKTLGKHTTKIKLHPEVSYELEWEVVSENPIEEAPTEEEQA